MNNTLKIKCPFCGAILAIKNQSGLENLNVTCPVCKTTHPIKSCKVIQTYQKEETKYFNQYDELNKNIGHIGQVRVIGDDIQIFHLELGENIIGRKASNSSAKIQLITESKRMSREHIIINVKESEKGYVHIVSLYKPKVNETLINQDPLVYGDSIILKHGDKIVLPDITLLFEIENTTNINKNT